MANIFFGETSLDIRRHNTKALYTPGLGEQNGVLEDSTKKVYLGYQNIDEILKLLKKKMN